MDGQLSLFGMEDDTKKHPYSYSFQRYIGQMIKFWRSGEVGKIVDIQPYYTIVDVGSRYMAGINITITPVDTQAESEVNADEDSN